MIWKRFVSYGWLGLFFYIFFLLEEVCWGSFLFCWLCYRKLEMIGCFLLWVVCWVLLVWVEVGVSIGFVVWVESGLSWYWIDLVESKLSWDLWFELIFWEWYGLRVWRNVSGCIDWGEFDESIYSCF